MTALRCNKDCFHCPFPDCINDDLDHEDYKELARIEREEIFTKTEKQRKVAAAQKAYREANREKVAAAQKAYYEANREKVAAAKKNALRDYRSELGYTQREVAKLVGISQPLISQYEHGSVPYDPALFKDIFPNLALRIKQAELEGRVTA